MTVSGCQSARVLTEIGILTAVYYMDGIVLRNSENDCVRDRVRLCNCFAFSESRLNF